MKYKVYHSPGKILKIGPYDYQDQLSEEFKVFSTLGGRHRKYLSENYGLTEVEYYFLVTTGDKDYRDPCPYCGEVNGHFASMSKGWNSYCNQSHITKYRLEKESREGRNPFQNDEFIEKNRIKVREFQKSRMEEGTHHLLTKECQLKAAKGNFIRKACGDEAVLYIARIENDESRYKYGTCSMMNPDKCRIHYRSVVLYNHHVLVKGPVEYIADLEYKLKIKFCDENDFSEFIDSTKFHEFLSYLKSIK